jgi:hypothetical protein
MILRHRIKKIKRKEYFYWPIRNSFSALEAVFVNKKAFNGTMTNPLKASL